MPHRSNVVYLGDLAEVFECLAARADVSVRAWVVEPGDLTPQITYASTLAGTPLHVAASSADVLDILRGYSALDLGVIANFGIILKRECLAVPAKGFVNLHMGLLPDFAGRRPVEMAIETDAPFAGVTLHRVIEKPDAGPVIESRKIARGEVGAVELFERLKRLAVEILAGKLTELLK